MDGNRRWAEERGLPPLAGHMRGAEALVKIVRWAAEFGIECLTVYAFSTENWKRKPEEIQGLMKLFRDYLIKQRELMIREGVSLDTIGDVDKLPQDVRDTLFETIEMTKNGHKMKFVLAVNYGARDEMKRAVHRIIDDVLIGKLPKESINEGTISSYLDTAKLSDPDLLIRTSGESRLSNFLLWQISYSEMVMSKVLWPEFSKKHLHDALLEYQKREVRIGK